jgi:hypothetical protein
MSSERVFLRRRAVPAMQAAGERGGRTAQGALAPAG